MPDLRLLEGEAGYVCSLMSVIAVKLDLIGNITQLLKSKTLLTVKKSNVRL